MGATLTQRRRVRDGGLRVVNRFQQGRDKTVPAEEAPANYVPAAAVIRRGRALSGFIGRKARVGGLAGRGSNAGAQPPPAWALPGAACAVPGSSGITRGFPRLFPRRGQVLHVLLSRSPLASPRRGVPFDLHVLGAPPAFILSQDRTLRPKGDVRHPRKY